LSQLNAHNSGVDFPITYEANWHFIGMNETTILFKNLNNAKIYAKPIGDIHNIAPESFKFVFQGDWNNVNIALSDKYLVWEGQEFIDSGNQKLYYRPVNALFDSVSTREIGLGSDYVFPANTLHNNALKIIGSKVIMRLAGRSFDKFKIDIIDLDSSGYYPKTIRSINDVNIDINDLDVSNEFIVWVELKQNMNNAQDIWYLPVFRLNESGAIRQLNTIYSSFSIIPPIDVDGNIVVWLNPDTGVQGAYLSAY